MWRCVRSSSAGCASPGLRQLPLPSAFPTSKVLHGHGRPTFVHHISQQPPQAQKVDRESLPRASLPSRSNPNQDEQEQELVTLSQLPAKEAGYEGIAGWVAAAMAFGAGVWYFQGSEKGQEFFAGYLLEQSLSVDNLFVFILTFKYFKTPPPAQAKVLAWGIGSAAVL